MYFSSNALNAGPDAEKATAITELARTAVSMVNNQIFKNGK